MKFNTGDFIIVKPEVGKPFLVRGKTWDKKNAVGYIEKSLNDTENTPKTTVFKSSEVVANLGKDPNTGTVFGVKVEPLIKIHETKAFGNLLQFVKMPLEFEKRMLSRMFKCRKVLKGKGLANVKYTLEFRPKKGKWAGTYYPAKQKIDIRPSFDWSDKDIDYVFYHEHSHALWFQLLSNKRKLKWINLYHEHVEIKEAGAQELKTMHEELVTNGDLKSFTKDLDDEGKTTLRAIFKYIRNVHKLTPSHISSMIFHQEDFFHLWPDITKVGKPEVHITEYSTVSPEEFFAEAFSLYMVGKKLPADVKFLLEKTLSTI